jgi:hypothetical protein
MKFPSLHPWCSGGLVGGVVVWLAGHAHLSCLDLRQWITIGVDILSFILPAIRVHQIHDDGTESVYIDTDQYSAHKLSLLKKIDPALLQERTFKTNLAFPWEEAYRNEAYNLDGWVRIVRLRPAMPCGLQLQKFDCCL